MKEKEFTASIVGVFILGGNTLTKEPRFYLDKAEIFFLRLTLLYLFAHYCTKGTHLFLYLGKVCDPDETRLVLP